MCVIQTCVLRVSCLCGVVNCSVVVLFGVVACVRLCVFACVAVFMQIYLCAV